MKKKILISIFLITAIVLSFTSVCYANSAEPPSIFIIVENAPEDMEISIDDITASKSKKHQYLETQFSFYNTSLTTSEGYTLDVSYSDAKYSIEIYAPTQYSNIYTLDYKNREIKYGKSLWRSAKYIALRVLMTLLIEALIFWAFRFKGKKVWGYFLAINLITQGVLNIWLSIASVPWSSYLIFGLIIGEIFVLLAEIIAFLIFIKDVPKWKTVLYVITANVLSLFLGGYLLTVIPI